MKLSDKERLKKIIKTWNSLQHQMQEHHITRDLLLNDEFSQWAVTTPLYNIGEQVYMLSSEFKQANPTISNHVLAQTLKYMEEQDLITKTVVDEL